jgi:hypothetical protein
MYDANNDGKISGDEFEKCPSLKSIAKNGEVTAEMIAAQIRTWQTSRVGRVSASIQMLRNSKPLGEVAVKLVPEKFLGDLETATGTTNPKGLAFVTVPTVGDGEPKGISLGFYRIEVTKDKEEIPAKYNTETVLGLGVIQDDTEEGNVFTFNLVY